MQTNLGRVMILKRRAKLGWNPDEDIHVILNKLVELQEFDKEQIDPDLRHVELLREASGSRPGR